MDGSDARINSRDIDAVILAAGRLPVQEAEQSGSEIKALIPIGATTPLRAVIEAMQASNCVARVIVVGPRFAQPAAGNVDLWVDEGRSGEENLLAGLRAVRARRALISASDMPFAQAAHVVDFLSRVPPDANFAYPVYTQAEFLAAFPGGRSKFARVGDTCWTGGSMCFMNVEFALRHTNLIRRGFNGRRNQLALASLFGMEVLARYVAGRLTVADIERRLSRLTGGRAIAVRGAHPALAMDLDSIIDVEYARTYRAAKAAARQKEVL